jgi:hypothetical protein
MATISTGVIENRKRVVTNLAISVSNESTAAASVSLAVYTVPAPGLSNAVVYVLNQFTLNPFNTIGSILTFDNVFANLDRFGVRATTGGAGAAGIAITVSGLDAAGNKIFEIFPGDELIQPSQI